MLVSDLRELIDAALETSALDSKNKLRIRKFTAALAKHDSLSVEALVKMFRLIPLPRKPAAKPKPVAQGILDSFVAAIDSDLGFEQVLDQAQRDRAVTKAALLAVYERLFGSSQGVPSKITKAELIETIRRERIRLVRSRKTHDFLGGQKRAI